VVLIEVSAEIQIQHMRTQFGVSFKEVHQNISGSTVNLSLKINNQVALKLLDVKEMLEKYLLEIQWCHQFTTMLTEALMLSMEVVNLPILKKV